MAMSTRHQQAGAETRIRDGAAALGILGALIGAWWLADGEELGFDRGAWLVALAAWLPETLPTALIASAAWSLTLAAGAAAARWVRRRPFETVADALLEGFVGAVLIDLALLLLLGPLGWFRAPALIAAQVGLAVSLRWAGPALDVRARVRPATLGVTPLAVLIGLAWAGPIVLGLTSPVVPFMDVLPNHVAPAEHLRTFGAMSELPLSPSPIYGPSRSLVGYTALLGTIATTTGLPAGAVVAGSIVPGLVLVGLAVRHLATRFGGLATGTWALVTFTLAAPFVRLPDMRATVLVLPIALWALAEVADRLEADDASPPRDALRLGAALGAAVLLHPVVGGLTILTTGVVVLARPALAPIGIPALAIASSLALPEVVALLGLGVPASLALLAFPAAGALGVALSRVPAFCRGLTRVARAVVPVGLLVGIVAGLLLAVEPMTTALAIAAGRLVGSMPYLALLAVAGALVVRREPSGVVLAAAAGVGLSVAVIGEAIPGEGVDLALAGLHFELPKAIQFWLPVVAAILAAVAVERLDRDRGLPVAARSLLLGLVVVGIAMPLRIVPIDRIHLGEHRISESLATHLGYAGEGYFSGFPDSRRLVDPPRQELLAALRAEIGAGRLGGDDEVLHIAGSFQQWVATPLGVLLGVIETDVVPEPERSIHTLGGRLEAVTALDGLLGSGRFGYVVLEPHEDLPPGLRERITGAGYRSIVDNGQGAVFRFETGG